MGKKENDMSKILDLNKPVFELAKEYPDFVDIFASLGFADIKILQC